MSNRYSHIPAIRNITDPSKRGYVFEQAVREILPWDHRPPLAVSAPNESAQFDAVFVWNSWHFIVESKAVEQPITAGSRGWEDFELKVRQRQRGSIGLFCSLYSVAERVHDRAVSLNREGAHTLLFTDSFWDDLADGSITFADVLHYMVFYCKTTFVSTPPALEVIERWAHDKDAAHRAGVDICNQFSALFLRRHQLPSHASIYVERGIDRTLAQMAASLQPSRLRTVERKRRRAAQAEEIVGRRARPAQIIVFRDASGSGKTTTAVQVGLTSSPFLGAVKAAMEDDIDKFDHMLLAKLSSDCGLSTLCALDRPVVLAIDSLDEASAIPHKSTQVLAALRLIDQLNDFAADSHNLLAYPIGLFFTVRDDYWERWHSIFEGREMVQVRTQYSYFTPSELDSAIARYSSVYRYHLAQPPSDDARNVLAVPFYLQVFSEANAFQGSVSTANVLGEHVLQTYFATKRESTLKRFIPGLTPALVIKVLGTLAAQVAQSDDLRTTWQDASAAIRQTAPLLQGYEDELLRAVVSEQILLRDADLSTKLRFRHLQFVEYLMAYRVVAALAAGDNRLLADVTHDALRVPLLSPHRVHSCIRFIGEREFPDTSGKIEHFYASSQSFIESVLPSLRRQISNGEATESNDLQLAVRASSSPGASSSWEAFFVLVAAANDQSEPVMCTAFENAWRSNAGKTDRWKLIDKMAHRGLLLHRSVALSILNSKDSREWETFLGSALDMDEREGFKSFWLATHGSSMHVGDDSEHWKHANYLLSLLLNDLAYVPGALAGSAPVAYAPSQESTRHRTKGAGGKRHKVRKAVRTDSEKPGRGGEPPFNFTLAPPQSPIADASAPAGDLDGSSMTRPRWSGRLGLVDIWRALRGR